MKMRKRGGKRWVMVEKGGQVARGSMERRGFKGRAGGHNGRVGRARAGRARLRVVEGSTGTKSESARGLKQNRRLGAVEMVDDPM